MGVSDFAYLVQRHDPAAAIWGAQVGDRGGALVNRALQLPGVAEQVIADFHELGPSSAVGLVVWEPVHRLNDDLVFHALGVGQPPHLYRIASGDAGRCLEQQAASRTATDQAGFGAGEASDFLSGFLVELVDVDHDPRGMGHLLQHFGPGASAAEAGHGTGGVDYWGYTQPPVCLFSGSGSAGLCQGSLLVGRLILRHIIAIAM